MTLRVGWFTTARGAGSRAMFEAVRDAIADGSLDARFAFVFCNREPGEDPATDEFCASVRDATYFGSVFSAVETGSPSCGRCGHQKANCS